MDLTDLYLNKSPKLPKILRNGFIIDTKIMILYLVGVIDTRKNTKYLEKFNLSKDDFNIFIRFKEVAKIEFFVMPNILTEFFNLVKNKIGSDFFRKYDDELLPFIDCLGEKYYKKEKTGK